MVYRPGGTNSYRADVDLSIAQSHKWLGCPNNGQREQTWDYKGEGPSEYVGSDVRGGFVGGGYVSWLHDTPDFEATYLQLNHIHLNPLAHYTGCSGDPGTDTESGLSGLSFYVTGPNYLVSKDPLPDTDPAPARLVGSRTWTMGDYPTTTSSPYNYTLNYSFTVTYDLHREPLGTPACSDGLDNDSDGRVDFPSDPGCESPGDLTELGTVQCDNGIDDDGDGRVDYRKANKGDADCDSLTDDSESPPCDDPRVTERVYSAADGTAFLNASLVPDPDFGQFALGVSWCDGPEGTFVDKVPLLYAELSGNWVFLGALEEAGFTPYVTEPTVQTTAKKVHAKAKYGVELSLFSVATGVFPYGKAAKAIAKASDRFDKALKAGMKKAEALKRFRGKVVDELDDLEDKFEDRLNDLLDAIPGVRGSLAAKWADTMTDFLEVLSPVLEDMLVDQARGLTEDRIVRAFEKLFKNVKVPLWKVDTTFTVADGTGVFSQSGSAPLLGETWEYTETR